MLGAGLDKNFQCSKTHAGEVSVEQAGLQEGGIFPHKTEKLNEIISGEGTVHLPGKLDFRTLEHMTRQQGNVYGFFISQL